MTVAVSFRDKEGRSSISSSSSKSSQQGNKAASNQQTSSIENMRVGKSSNGEDTVGLGAEAEGRAHVTVQVLDYNEFKPKFPRSLYHTQLTEEDDRHLPKKIISVRSFCFSNTTCHISNQCISCFLLEK